MENNQTKFSKVLGEVNIVTEDTTTVTVLVLKTGETKKLLKQYANLTDVKVKVIAKKEVVRDLTEEEINHLSFINRNGNTIAKAIEKSSQNLKAGKAGLSSLTK